MNHQVLTRPLIKHPPAERVSPYLLARRGHATDAADYLVGKGVPFRDAHGIIGQLVLYCLDRKCSIEDLSIEELQAVSSVFEEDVYEAVSLKTCVEKRLTVGAPGPEAMRKIIEIHREYLSKDWHEEEKEK